MGDSTFLCCAYCWKHEDSWDDILSYRCDRCKKRVHYNCIKSSQPSVLQGDSFFNFHCQACSENGKEHFKRMPMAWVDVVMLSLFNLHRTGQGLRGFYHWRSHIANFIETHWATLFGSQRKRTSLWQGTVAGTLSSGCPQYFESGSTQVDQGFWRLCTLQPPLPQVEKKLSRSKGPARDSPVELKPGQLRSRSRAKDSSSLAAAMLLKEKRAQTQEGKKRTQKNSHHVADTGSSSGTSIDSEVDPVQKKIKKSKVKPNSNTASQIENNQTDNQDSLSHSVSNTLIKSSFSNVDKTELAKPGTDLGILTPIQMEEDSDLEIDVDIDAAGFPLDISHDLWPNSPDINTILNIPETSDCSEEATSLTPCYHPEISIKSEPISDQLIKQELVSDCESEGQSERDIEEKSIKGEDAEGSDSEQERTSDSSEDEGDEDSEKQSLISADSETTESKEKSGKKMGRPRKRRRNDDTPPPSPPPRLQPISLFEEGELLQKLNIFAEREPLPSHLAQLRRKLICNQTNREFGLPVFDLQQAMNKGKEEISNLMSSLDCHFLSGLKTADQKSKETRDLDRFMIQEGRKSGALRQYTTFHQRLVGLEDHELRPFTSPYTTRLLLPFIWRNHNPSQKPIKMKLLQEIVAFHHRDDPQWVPPDNPSIDYCYVRPEHIPSVNALCREFFWPGIDMSECLQYPDYSCVVMYKKIVIAFAFLVPDRGYNEAYISFVFTHPEWRGVGIATFMVYHLIQTCMGKDVLLHVSVTNPAMLLYQRFGFKAQELIQHFYHKYFPLNSVDSTHAFLMRLSR